MLGIASQRASSIELHARPAEALLQSLAQQNLNSLAHDVNQTAAGLIGRSSSLVGAWLQVSRLRDLCFVSLGLCDKVS